MALSAWLACTGGHEPDIEAERKALIEQLDAVRNPVVRRRSDPRPDVVLVSLDTVRADAVSAYGGLLPGGAAARATPTLDALAGSGVRFDFALAQSPTTLSSHSAVFTGLDSHGHGVVRNGFVLGNENETLAERFTVAGYTTVGVIGASVLHEKTGISRGFGTWDSTLSHDRNERHEALASEVTERALDAVRKANEGKPVFLFVHYFDAHGPYDAPVPYTKRFCDPLYAGFFDGSRTAMKSAVRASRDRKLTAADVAQVRCHYLGEVAYVDTHVSRLFEGISTELGADTPRVVAVFGDHGEVLGEEPLNPFGHGGSVDAWALRVPLLVAGTNVPANVVVPSQARLVDLGTTLLALSGVRGSLGMGVDLANAWSHPATSGDFVTQDAAAPSVPGQPSSPISFAEASQPDDDAAKVGWPNLPFARVAYRDGFACQRFPLSYPGVLTYRVHGNVQEPVLDPAAAKLCDALAEWDRRLPTAAEQGHDAATTEALEVLGYSEPHD